MSILSKKFSSHKYTASYFVEESQSGIRLDIFLKEFLPGFSREQIKAQIKNKNIKIKNRNGNHKPNTKLYHTDIVVFTILEDGHEDEFWKGKKLDIQRVPKTIFEDEDIIIIHKPAFMSTHPTGRHLFNCATVFYEMLHKQTIHSIHRIDRETSGILMLGKSPKAATKLTTLFEKNLVRKCYFLIAVKNKNIPEKLTAKERLGGVKSGLDRVYINAYPEDSSEGKRAETSFTKIWENERYIISLAFPVTGRQHQIRVHAFTHGFPLLGDKLYLGSFKMFQRFKDNIASLEEYNKMQIPRHALHAIGLHFPYKSKEQTFISEIPNDLKIWIKDNLKNINQDHLLKKIKENIYDYFAK